MKKITKILIVLTVVSLFAMKSKAQEIGVRVQLNRPARYERFERHHPHRPSARYHWIAEEWVWRGGRYNYVPGHWGVPPRPESVWVNGHWQRFPNGYNKWIPGHWS